MKAFQKPKLILITGVPGVGKTTVAQALTERLKPATSISIDGFRHKVRPYTKSWEKPEGVKQARLAIDAAIATARIYLDSGLSVVVDDVINAEGRKQYQSLLDDWGGVIILLKPSLEIAQKRYTNRGISPSGQHRTEELYAALNAEDFDLTIDNSELTVEQTVEEIAKGFDQ